MDYLLPSVTFTRLCFTLESLGEAVLPDFKGSMLRGTFGHALRKTVCVMKPDAVCGECMLRTQCAYTRIFETFIENTPPPFLKGIRTSPRPFVIHAFDPRTRFQRGDSFSFTLTLIGKACDFHPYVIFAFLRAAETGFTKSRYSFKLTRVTLDDADHTLVYDGDKQAIVRQVVPQKTKPNGSLNDPVRLEFLTPTRIRTNGKLSMPSDFRPLAFTMLRRVCEMAYFHEPEVSVDWNFGDLLDRANGVRIAESRLEWEDWKRYSSRQKTEMDIGGFKGHITLQGEVAPFSDLLRTAEVLHVGKGTVFGLGRVRVGENIEEIE